MALWQEKLVSLFTTNTDVFFLCGLILKLFFQNTVPIEGIVGFHTSRSRSQTPGSFLPLNSEERDRCICGLLRLAKCQSIPVM